ncbi:substrate-binding domain-containing protein [Candidatus Nitrospira bockiana]
MATIHLVTIGLWLLSTNAIAGLLVIAGNGPELPAIERLALAFEKGHPGTAIEIRWDRSSRPIQMVTAGEVDFAVTGEEVPPLHATPVAWDGIAFIVNFGNPVKDVSTGQLAAILSRKTTRWSEVGGSNTPLALVDRPHSEHIRHRIEEALGIRGERSKARKIVHSDQDAISTVAGDVSAMSYVSLGVALEAVKYGVGVAVLTIDGTEPADHTVKDGRYALRRPVFLVSRRGSNSTAEAFVAFVRSQAGQSIMEELFTAYMGVDH